MFDPNSIDGRAAISLKVSPRNLKAGRDSYDVWIEGQKVVNTSVTIQYQLNDGPVNEFVVGLDGDGKANLYVSSATGRGSYHFTAFRPPAIATLFIRISR
jgi:hypothetical protein